MASTNKSGLINDEAQFPKTKAGWHQRWSVELTAAKKASKKFHTRGNKVVNRFIDNRGAGEEDWFKLNLFHSDTQTVMAMMYGNLPKVDVSRSFADANDDVARVAGVIIQRMLNFDIQRPADAYATVLRQCLEDRLVPGMGKARIRYEVEQEDNEVEPIQMEDGTIAAEGYTETTTTYEAAIVDYVHWRDYLWSPCRTYADKRWDAYRVYMTRDELIARFGEKLGNVIPLTKTSLPEADDEFSEKEAPNEDAWSRAEVWEIWSGEHEKVFWFCFDYPKILDIKDDPLELDGFYSGAMPMAANTTTTAYMPIPDYHMAQDLYNQIDKLETRISMITEAVRVVGVYDASATGLKRMLTEGGENDMIPVDNWAMFAEKGGIAGTVDWMPVKEIAETMSVLVGQRDMNIGLLHQVTGHNEIMRGGTSGVNSGGPITATESATAAKFGSVRMQKLQEEFADFATALMRLKTQVICKHFSRETIMQHANVDSMLEADIKYVEPAIELLKSGRELLWKVDVKSENISMVDYAVLKQERVEFMGAASQFMQSAVPLMELDQGTVPLILETMKWVMAGFKGSDTIEGVMDEMIDVVKENIKAAAEAPPEPSPEEKQAQADQAAAQEKHQMSMQLQQAKTQADLEKENNKLQTKLQEIQAQLDANIQETQSISGTKILEIDAAAEASILQSQVEHDLDIKAEEHETDEVIKREKAKPKPSTSAT